MFPVRIKNRIIMAVICEVSLSHLGSSNIDECLRQFGSELNR